MNNKKIIWQQPWGYAESYIIVLALLILGFLINYFGNSTVHSIQWPFNLYLGIATIFFLLLIYFLFKKTSFIKWLSSYKAAISAISLYLFIILLMGFIPQETIKTHSFFAKIGLFNILSSYAFLFTQIYFFLSLGMVTIKRAFPFKRKNIAFLLNHFGLWLTLFSATLGAGDLQRITLTANKTDAVYYGLNQDRKTINDLGIAIKLTNFIIEEYAPKAFIIDSKSNDIINENLFFLKKGNKGDLKNWNIEVKEFHKNAVKIGDKYHNVNEIGAPPAAFVILKNKKTLQKAEGWISCGSFRYPGNYLILPDGNILVMAEPEPKKFSSEVKIYSSTSSDIIEATVEVNKPAKVNGWKIYQLDYDHEKGKWSETSTLELVKDPWIPLVYLGIFMMIAGALYMFWIGNKKN